MKTGFAEFRKTWSVPGFLLAALFSGMAQAATLYVGGCGSPGHATIQAAVNAAGGGDTILVCPGTYNEAVSIPRTLTVRGSTGNAADVTVTHSGMTVSQSVAGTLTLKDMTVTSTGATAVYLQWNADGGHVFENLVVSGRNYGIYAERGATNLKNITAAGTDYSAIYLGNKHAATFDTVTATGASHGIHVAHSDTTSKAYSFTRVTASSRERAIRITRSGKVTMNTVTATSAAHTAIHLEWDADGGHTFENVAATGDNYGIYADRGAASLKNVAVASQRQTAIYLGNKYAATFDTVTAASANYGGLWIGNSDSASHGYSFTNVKVTAKGTGISIDRSGTVTMNGVEATSTATGDAGRAAISLEWNADGGHKLENVTAANNARWYGAIYLARGAVTLKNIIAKNTFTGTNGTQNEAIRMGSKYGDSFDTLTAESGGGGGIAILNNDSASNSLGFKDVTVTSKYTGIDIQRSGTVTMNGIKVSSSAGAGIYLGWNADAGNRHRFSNLDITAAATGLQTAQGLGWVEDFKIKITSNNGAGIFFTSKYDASVQRGTIDVGNNYGISVNYGEDKSVTVADVTIQSGGTVEGIRLNRSSSALIQRVCTSGSSNIGIRAQWDARNVTIKNSQFANGGAYGGVMIYSNSSYKATVTNNAFLKTAPRRAYSDSNVHTFNGNFWQGVAGGVVYTDGNIKDNRTLASNPVASCYGGAAKLSAHYKFDDTWSASDTLDDSSGNGKHAALNGTVVQEAAPASGIKPATCKAGNFNKAGWFGASGLDANTAANGKNSVSFWMYWDGGFHSSNFTMPFSWGSVYYDLAVSKYRSDMGNGVIGFNTGNGDVFGVTADGLANGWHHVAAVFNNGNITQNKLYIDGVQKTLTSYGGHSDRSATTSAGIGAGLNWSGDYKWSGKLDNVKIYKGEIDSVQIAADMAETVTCASLDHIRIEHDGSGLTCQREPIVIKACQDANCSTPYSGGDVGMTLSPTGWYAAASGGSETNALTLAGGGQATRYLQKTTPGDVTLGVTGAVTPAPVNGVRCFNGSTETCTLAFADAGLIFTADTNPGLEASIPTQIAGVDSGQLYVRAAKSDGSGQCVSAVSGGTATLGYVCEDPIPSRCSSGSLSPTVTPSFNSNGYAGPFQFAYNDAGKIHLTASATASPSGTLSGVSNAFVVKPHHFDLSAIQCTDGTANPGATDASGAKFCKAGDDFNVTVTARSSTGTATPNFGQEVAAETVKLTQALVGGLGLTESPTLSGSLGGFAGGVASGNFQWSEVGIIALTPSIGDTDYLGVGDISGTASGNVGRFYPHHLALTLPTTTNTCTTGTMPFTYFGEDGFTSVFTLTAQNASNVATQNYAGDGSTTAWAKLPLTTWGAAPASAGSPGYGFAVSTWAPSQPAGASLAASATAPAAANWAAGTTTVTAKHMISRPSSPTVATTVTITALPVDRDGATMTAAASLGTALQRFGRLRLVNFYGSELLPARVEYRVESSDGNRWTTNADDVCTSIIPANIATGGLTVGNVGALANGIGFITFNTAGAGSYDIAVNLGATANDTSCNANHPASTAANRPWLQGFWSGNCGATPAWQQDPGARIRLGSPRAPYIYLRERY